MFLHFQLDEEMFLKDVENFNCIIWWYLNDMKLSLICLDLLGNFLFMNILSLAFIKHSE